MVARYQDGRIGRFISVDPLAQYNPAIFLSDPQQFNTYAYSRNNPLRFIDPFGLFNKKTGEIEKGDNLTSITNTLNETYGTNFNINDVARANKIEDPNKIYAGNYITLPKTNLELQFDNEQLEAYDKTYGITYPDLSWEGTSGNDKNDPIPDGKWKADPNDTEKFNDLPWYQKFGSSYGAGLWPGGLRSWGTMRTELDNVTTGEQNTGYYIHGGWAPGSAGCIDLTNQNESFHNWFTNDWGKSIEINVKIN